jgi:hypothetical protein
MAKWWMIVTAVGWSVGGSLGQWAGSEAVRIMLPNWGYTGIIAGDGEFLNHFVAGSLGTSIFAIITGFGLVWLLHVPVPRHKPSQPPHSTSPS